MKIYLAAPYAVRNTLRHYAAELERIGFEITSTWLDETHDIKPGTQGPAADLDDAQVNAHARQDLADINKANVLVLWTAKACGAEGGGGRHVETGYAIAQGMPIIVIGEPENVFHRMTTGITVVPTWHAAVVDLSRRLVERERTRPRAADDSRTYADAAAGVTR